MMTLREMVREFHERFSLLIGNKPATPSLAMVQARCGFSLSEFGEMLRGAGCPPELVEIGETAFGHAIAQVDMTKFDMVEFVDGHLDLAYFGEGTLLILGVDTAPLHAEVHRANMSKLWADGKPRFREGDGKIVKPPSFEPPDIGRLLEEQGWRTQ